MSSVPNGPLGRIEIRATGFQAELQAADTIPEVIALTRAFMETWSAPEILRLPFHCRPGRITDAKQIQELAFLLEHAQAHFDGRLIDAMVLDRMASGFSAAARAIDRILDPL